MTFESFLRLNPPTFTGNPLIDDPQLFLDRANKAFRFLKYMCDRAVELVAYNLIGPVEQWYEALLDGRRATGQPSLV